MYRRSRVEAEREITISVSIEGEITPGLPGITEGGRGPLISPPEPATVEDLQVKFGDIDITDELSGDTLDWLSDVILQED